MTKQDLEDRIADAFEDERGSAELSALLDEVAAAEEAARTRYADAKEIALDPATRPQAVDQARKDMDDAEFRASRMSNATAKLKDLLSTARDREAADRRREEYAAARKERDELAAELAKSYPTMVEKLVSLLDRIVASDKRVEAANVGCSSDTWIAPVESHARNIAPNAFDGIFPKLTTTIRLPRFSKSQGGQQWPKPSRF